MSGIFKIGVTNEAHKAATKLMESAGSVVAGQKVVVLSFDSLRILIENSMVDGAEFYRKKLTGQK